MPGSRQSMRQDLYRLAADQAGYFTAAQAIDIGYSYQAQKYHVDHDNWTRVSRGVFRIPEWPSSPNDSLARWVLWSKSRAVVSHDSAAAAHNIGLLNPPNVHLTVPPDFRMTDDHIVLYHRHLPASDVTLLDGAPITTILQTVMDIVVTHFDEELVGTVVRDAVDDGRVSRRQLERRIEELGHDDQDRAQRLIQRAIS